MAIHHPPRAGRARRSPGSVPLWGLRVGLALSVGIVAAGCSSSGDDASALPDELTAAEDAEAGTDQPAGTTGEEPSTGIVVDDGFVAEGFEPIEEGDDDPEPPAEAESVELTDDSPAAVIDAVADDVDGLQEGQELLDAIGPLDRAEPPSGESDGRPRNGVGELLELDAEASLACGQVEIAIGQLDIGLPGVATERILSAADRADASAIEDISTWADPLRDVVDGGPIDDPAPLVGFLSVCTEGGYEL